MQAPLHFIAVLLPPEYAEPVESIKLELFETYGCKVALRSPPHITLVPPFRRTETELPQLMKHFGEAALGLRPFDLEVDSIGRFDKRVLFEKVRAHQALTALHVQLSGLVAGALPRTPDSALRPYHPHITLATRDLRGRAFTSAWQELRNQSLGYSFRADRFSLMRHLPEGDLSESPSAIAAQGGYRWRKAQDFAFSRVD